MTKPRAKDSHLRTCMLGLHKEGHSVTFFEGNPDIPGDTSQMFVVKLKDNTKDVEFCSIMSDIWHSVRKSADEEVKEPVKITMSLAKSHVERMQEFEKKSKEQR